MSQQIFTGVWTDWNRGRVLGATITISARDGALLLAFVATFVTFVATRLWKTIIFVCHQILATGGKHDGLYHQRQLILRNTPTPIAATGLFLQQAWHWRRSAESPHLRTLPWAIFGILYVAAFTAAALFSARISEGATEFRLLAGGDCGMFFPEDRDALQQKATFDNTLASVYARQCYKSSSAAQCKSLPVPAIRWTNNSIECPFGDDICVENMAFSMESEMISSHTHLGINQPEEYRVNYSRETVCAPLITGPRFTRNVNGTEAEAFGWDDNVLIKYFYGSRGFNNYTHIYNTYGTQMQTGYSTWAYYSLSHNEENLWTPIDALGLDGSDITLLLIAPNSVVHIQPNNDPVFGANYPLVLTDKTTYYQPDRFVSPIACADRHRVCNPTNGVCTTPRGSGDIMVSAQEPRMGLNEEQLATVQRIRYDISGSTFYHLIWTRTQSFLEAQELVGGLTQLALPSDQWKIEVGRLFDDAMARLQLQMMEYATGPAIAIQGTTLKPWEPSTNFSGVENQFNIAQEAMCRSQITRDTQGTLNFSVLGLSLLLALGFAIIVLSFVLEPLTLFIERKTGCGMAKAQRWERDENLQVMRMFSELRNGVVWKGDTDSFPVTESKDKFSYDSEYRREEQTYVEVRHEVGVAKA